ncbi:MAG: hypothetical protein HFI89_04585 [Lachnospiraceae bacterium]|nr:hypothetical protein [Lachnospiraceae bacterium]
MKVVVSKNCVKKQSSTARQKSMASIGFSAFMSENPKHQIDILHNTIYNTNPIENTINFNSLSLSTQKDTKRQGGFILYQIIKKGYKIIIKAFR